VHSFLLSQHPQYNQWCQLHHYHSYIQVTSLLSDIVASLSLIVHLVIEISWYVTYRKGLARTEALKLNVNLDVLIEVGVRGSM